MDWRQPDGTLRLEGVVSGPLAPLDSIMVGSGIVDFVLRRA